jgi:multidrug efflux pump subunit AcrA (membrane-fusion protein)
MIPMRNYLPAIFICLNSLLIVSCSKKQESTIVTEESISESVYASGNIKSDQQYQVFAKVTGTLADILIEAGQPVRKNQLILKIKNENATLSTNNAKLLSDFNELKSNQNKLKDLLSNIENAKNKLHLDSIVYSRQQNLWNQQTGSRFDLEQKELNYKNSKNNYESALYKYQDLKKQLKLADQQSKNNLAISETIQNDFEIRSEIDGKVFNILKEKGELISPQSPIAVIGAADKFILELQVDEYDIARIKIGQNLFYKLDSYKGKVFEATVKKINPIMNERTKSFTVEAELKTQPDNLYPNLTTEANIVIQTKTNALLIPRNYMLNDSQVVIQNKDVITIQTGLKDNDKVEVLSGLKKGDVIFKPIK